MVIRVLASLSTDHEPAKRFGPEEELPSDDQVDEIADEIVAAGEAVQRTILKMWELNGLVRLATRESNPANLTSVGLDKAILIMRLGNATMKAVDKVLLAAALLGERLSDETLRTGQVKHILNEFYQPTLAASVTTHVNAMIQRKDGKAELEKMDGQLPRDEVSFRITNVGRLKIQQLLS